MSKNNEKTSLRIRRYFTNLFRALFGMNPFQNELDEAKEQMQKSAENLSAMQDQLCAALERWDDAMKALDGSEKQVKSLQTLTENLRERIAEKDKMIEALESELNKK